jgi:AbrB family looped-hinge helix DNA binding protein
MSETEAKTTRVSEKGQTTIPKEIRDRLGIEPGDQVQWSEADGEVTVEKETPASTHGILLADDVTEEERGEVAEEMDEYVKKKRRNEWDGESTRANVEE